VLTTPIDVHLPLVVAIILVCAWILRRSRWAAAVQCAVPILVAIAMTIAHEQTRLLAYGVVGALCLGVAALRERNEPESLEDALLACAAVVLLRWIPLRDVHVAKELIILAGTVALLSAMPKREHGRGIALIAVVAVAVVTPIPPGKMALLPFALSTLVLATRKLPQPAIGALLLVCACFARFSLATVYVVAAIVFLVPLLDRIRPLVYAATLVILSLWPWSGIIARSLPVVRNFERASGDVIPIARALAPSETVSLPVPAHVRHFVVTASGGQMARLKRGRSVGTIDVEDVGGATTRRILQIGDIADFGFMRREQFFSSRNPLPRVPSGEIRDYGANAWMWGGGRVAIASRRDIAAIRVTAAPDLPHAAHLQIDSVEFPAR